MYSHLGEKALKTGAKTCKHSGMVLHNAGKKECAD